MKSSEASLIENIIINRMVYYTVYWKILLVYWQILPKCFFWMKDIQPESYKNLTETKGSYLYLSTSETLWNKCIKYHTTE